MNGIIDRVFERGIALVAFMIGSFHLLTVSGLIVLSTRDIRISHLMMLVLLFMTRANLKRLEASTADRLLRMALIAVSVASCDYLTARWKDIAFSGGATAPMDAWVGIAVLFLVLEAARRGVGLVLAIICLIFFTYPFFPSYLPGVFYGRGYSLTRMPKSLTTTSQGVFGIPWASLPPISFCSRSTDGS